MLTIFGLLSSSPWCSSFMKSSTNLSISIAFSNGLDAKLTLLYYKSSAICLFNSSFFSKVYAFWFYFDSSFLFGIIYLWSISEKMLASEISSTKKLSVGSICGCLRTMPNFLDFSINSYNFNLIASSVFKADYLLSITLRITSSRLFFIASTFIARFPVLLTLTPRSFSISN